MIPTKLYHYRRLAFFSASAAGWQRDKWTDGDSIEWNWNGRRLHHTFRTADTFGAKEVVEAAFRFPSLKRWTGMEDSWLYYARLKQSQ